MPSYRLVAGRGTILEGFDAADDADAIRCAHELSLDFPGVELAEGSGGYLRLERHDGHCWQLLFGWMPGC
jgi:hypothetical protein